MMSHKSADSHAGAFNLSQILSHQFEENFHSIHIASLHYALKFGKPATYVLELSRCVWIEENLTQQEVVLAHQPVGYRLVPFESRTRCRLMLHTSTED